MKLTKSRLEQIIISEVKRLREVEDYSEKNFFNKEGNIPILTEETIVEIENAYKEGFDEGEASAKASEHDWESWTVDEAYANSDAKKVVDELRGYIA